MASKLMWAKYPDGVYLIEISQERPPETVICFVHPEEFGMFCDMTEVFRKKLLMHDIPGVFREAFKEGGDAVEGS